MQQERKAVSPRQAGRWITDAVVVAGLVLWGVLTGPLRWAGLWAALTVGAGAGAWRSLRHGRHGLVMAWRWVTVERNRHPVMFWATVLAQLVVAFGAGCALAYRLTQF